MEISTQKALYGYGRKLQTPYQTNKHFCLVGMKESLWHMVDVLLRRLKIYVP
jgi:hypothetical protein